MLLNLKFDEYLVKKVISVVCWFCIIDISVFVIFNEDIMKNHLGKNDNKARSKIFWK